MYDAGDQRTYLLLAPLVAPVIVTPGENRVIALEPGLCARKMATKNRIVSCGRPSAGCGATPAASPPVR